MYDGTIAEALAGTEMIRSGLSAIRRFMFCASTAGSKTEERTVTLAPCFSRPLLTELAHAAQNGFWFVQMMTPTFLPSSAPVLAACTDRARDEDGREHTEHRERHPTG